MFFDKVDMSTKHKEINHKILIIPATLVVVRATSFKRRLLKDMI